jgi:AcrR family transcriptional regulator
VTQSLLPPPLDRGDLTARARIRDAAVVGIAEYGVRGVTVRTIAAQAGVSPALVIHHFGSKQGVVDAAAAAVLEWMQQATAESANDDDPAGAHERRLERFERLLSEQPAIRGFVRRMLLEGTPAGLAWFRGAVDRSAAELLRRERSRMARPSYDVRAEATMLLILWLAPLLLGPLVEHALDVDFADEAAQVRWRRAQTELLTSSLYPRKRKVR